MSLTFDAGPHVYTLDGVVVPSVTGILQASGLIDTLGHPRADPRRGETAGGRVVHEAVHFANENDLDVEAFP